MKYRIEQEQDHFIIFKKILFWWVMVRYTYTKRELVHNVDEFWWMPISYMDDIEYSDSRFETKEKAEEWILNH